MVQSEAWILRWFNVSPVDGKHTWYSTWFNPRPVDGKQTRVQIFHMVQSEARGRWKQTRGIIELYMVQWGPWPMETDQGYRALHGSMRSVADGNRPGVRAPHGSIRCVSLWPCIMSGKYTRGKVFHMVRFEARWQIDLSINKMSHAVQCEARGWQTPRVRCFFVFTFLNFKINKTK